VLTVRIFEKMNGMRRDKYFAIREMEEVAGRPILYPHKSHDHFLISAYRNSQTVFTSWFWQGFVTNNSPPEAYENDDDDLDGEVQLHTRLGRERFVRRLAVLARTELYITDRTPDQVMQVREWAVRYCKQHDIRDVDIVKLLPKVQQLAFVETRYEREAREMTLSDEYQRRYRNTYGRYYSRSKHWLFNWFGTKVTEPAMPTS
jgi:hypothetical protein